MLNQITPDSTPEKPREPAVIDLALTRKPKYDRKAMEDRWREAEEFVKSKTSEEFDAWCRENGLPVRKSSSYAGLSLGLLRLLKGERALLA
jgi:hypothetical protein